MKAAYPNSIWTKYITAGHTSRNTNSMPFVLNYIRKASRLSGYNLFPFFERWGFLRQVAMYIGDYGNGWCVFPKAAYDEFKADMDELVAKAFLRKCQKVWLKKSPTRQIASCQNLYSPTDSNSC